uniref:Uncharacterized protein n=1 Tax=Rhizophagus irregularis (strain DAOM 181602 / DAOM 197198 / MUCL 43194) TaxID=747089 RepID=U9TYX2_RHIID
MKSIEKLLFEGFEVVDGGLFFSFFWNFGVFTLSFILGELEIGLFRRANGIGGF